jgi:hypothetical protein
LFNRRAGANGHNPEVSAMVVSFKEAMIENAESGLIFGNVNHFGESGTYTTKGGSGATVQATCLLRELQDSQEEIVDRDQEELEVSVCKNAACARGGVATPGDGDTYMRPGDSIPWSFQRIVGETSGEWLLLFARRRPKRYGPRQ